MGKKANLSKLLKKIDKLSDKQLKKVAKAIQMLELRKAYLSQSMTKTQVIPKSTPEIPRENRHGFVHNFIEGRDNR
jgi:hypothetical protein